MTTMFVLAPTEKQSQPRLQPLPQQPPWPRASSPSGPPSPQRLQHWRPQHPQLQNRVRRKIEAPLKDEEQQQSAKQLWQELAARTLACPCGSLICSPRLAQCVRSHRPPPFLVHHCPLWVAAV